MKKHLKLLTILLSVCTALTGCSKNSIDDKQIIVGASPSPHAEILKQCESYIKTKGYKLDVEIYTDYILPNVALKEGEIDANFFQHAPYLENWCTNNKASLVSVATIHYEPLGIYAGKSTDLSQIKDGAKIAVPNDPTNNARALLLLNDLGIIEIDQSKGIDVKKHDILSNPHNIGIIEFEAAIIPAQLVEVDYAVINGNYAITSNVDSSKLLAKEDKNSLSATTYANIVAIQDGHQDKEAIKILVEALSQQSIKDYISNTYQGGVVAL